MHNLGQKFKYFMQKVLKGDMVLLVMCLAISAFSCLVLSSVTNAEKFGGSMRYIVIQMGATVLGVIFYAIMSSIDLESFSEHRRWLVISNLLLILLLIPFGTDNNTGNRSWIPVPVIGIHIQPAEICKILYILITASVMNSHQNRISNYRSIIHIGIHLLLVAGLYWGISGDLGVTLIFVFVLLGMAIGSGISLPWFIGIGVLASFVLPLFWKYGMDTYQKNRILALFDPTIDPQGIGVRYHAKLSLQSLTGGGLTGQGLFNGNRTQAGIMPAQQTDFIFSAIGEELGYVGCIVVIIVLFALVARCIWVGLRSKDYMRRLVCIGVASALIFQICINIGMCIGVVPVIGLTLPLISYGGSSVVTIYAMLGLVSGVYARPAAKSHERYIQPPR